jgi:hypothetical protein
VPSIELLPSLQPELCLLRSSSLPGFRCARAGERLNHAALGTRQAVYGNRDVSKSMCTANVAPRGPLVGCTSKWCAVSVCNIGPQLEAFEEGASPAHLE